MADDSRTRVPSSPAQCTSRVNAGRSSISKSSGSSSTKSLLIKRSMGAIWRPPRWLSVAGVKWSMVQTSTGAASNALTAVSCETRWSKGWASKLPSNSTWLSSSSRAWRDAEPVFSASRSWCSNRARLALPPTRIASSSSPKPSMSRKARPVCSVRVRKPIAKAQRMPWAGSASAYMTRALAKVFPQPVEAILTIKAPCCWARLCMACAMSTALSCQR